MVTTDMLHLSRQLTGRRVGPNPSLSFLPSTVQYSSPATVPLVPNRVERGPTDILRALADTVGQDFTGPHYRYHDDPWLIPYRNTQKKDYSLSKEAGRKAARYVLDKHPDLFEHNRISAEPPITAFQPRAAYNRDNVTLELLDNLVNSFQVSDSVQVFKLLEEKGKVVPVELKRNLLELVAFYNEEDAEEDGSETQGMLSHTIQGNSKWKVGGLADQLYSSGGQSTPQDRLAMLVGLARYDKHRAAQMLAECRANKDPLTVEGYNAAVVALASDGVEKLMIEVKDILTEMKEHEVAPNTDTLINILSRLAGLSRSQEYRQCCNHGLSVLAEFKVLGVVMSLGVYKSLLELFSDRKNVKESGKILVDIMQELEGREMWPPVSKEDIYFLPRAMSVANQMHNVQLGWKINEFLLTGRNINLLSNMQQENTYYQNFLTVVLNNDSLDTAMALYNQITPHLWAPSTMFYKSLLGSLHSGGAMQHISKVFDDIVFSDYGGSNREGQYEVNLQVLQILQANSPSESQFTGLSEVWVNIASRVFSHLVENKTSKALYLRFNNLAANICSLVVSVMLRESKYEEAVAVFDFCKEEKSVMPGNLSEAALEQLMGFCSRLKDTDKSLEVVEYVLDVNSGLSVKLANSLADECQLSDSQIKLLNKLFASEPSWVPK